MVWFQILDRKPYSRMLEKKRQDKGIMGIQVRLSFDMEGQLRGLILDGGFLKIGRVFRQKRRNLSRWRRYKKKDRRKINTRKNFIKKFQLLLLNIFFFPCSLTTSYAAFLEDKIMIIPHCWQYEVLSLTRIHSWGTRKY